ncbi:hypothetical protein JCM17380_43920 [Desulfosporosinus burensis]
MKKMKKQLAVAVTVALLTLPLGTSMVLAETDNSLTTTSTTSETTTTDVATTDTTATDDATGDGSTTDDTTTDDTTTDDTTTDDETTDDTTTDDTPVTDDDGVEVAPSNWFTNLIGKLQLALTFDPVRKSELSERQALAKLARAQKLMSEGKIEAAEIALSEYSDKITKAQEFLEQVEDPNTEKAIKLNIALTNVNSNNINVLSNLLEKLPPQAAQKLALNVVHSMEKAVKKIEKQEAKVALTIPTVTISETVPATTAPATESVTTEMSATKDKSLEKQAKIVLKDFKKSLKEKGTIQQEEVEQSDDEDNDAEGNDTEDNDTDNITSEETAPASQEPSNSQPTSVTVAPAQLQKSPTTSTQSSGRDNKEKTKRDEPSKEKSRDNGGDKKAKSDKRD